MPSKVVGFTIISLTRFLRRRLLYGRWNDRQINQQDWNLKRDVKEFRKTPDSLDNPINISLREFVSTFATVLTPIFGLILKPIRQIAAAFHHLFIDILACPDCVARKRIKRDANAYVYRDAFTGGPSITGRYCVPANRTIYGA